MCHSRIMLIILQIHSFYQTCNGKASCNCGVAVRSGDDIIVFDSCDPDGGKKVKHNPLDIRMYLNGELTPGTRVHRYGNKKYQVGTTCMIMIV